MAHLGELSGLLIGAAAFTSACGLAAVSEPEPTDGKTRRDTEVVHEVCELQAQSAERLDANADGRADVVLVREGGRVVCQAVDLNFDGKIDAWTYLDDKGQPRRREHDYDRDGRIDEIVLYKAGTVSEKQLATTLAHRLDTWHFYRAGRLIRTERDADGDGIVDKWWEYRSDDCPMMHSDANGDGRPDPLTTIDYCKETGYVPPERPGPRTTSGTDLSTDPGLATEVDSKPVDEATEESAAGDQGEPEKSPASKDAQGGSNGTGGDP